MADDAPSGPDVFLSYAREDEARARELATALGQRGLSVFWDREIPPGQTWHSHIGRALAKARCVVVAWSRHSIASDWVIEEANEGKRRSILVPVLFETVPPPFGFGGIQGANLVEWRHGQPSPGFDKLFSAVQRIIGGQAGSGIEADGVAPLKSQSGRWSGRMALAALVGFVALAGAGGAAVFWSQTPAEFTSPPLPAPTPSTPEPGPPVETSPSPAPTPSIQGRSPEPAAGAEPAVAPSPSATLGVGEGKRDCPKPECPEMVLVPAGEFTMGSPPDEPGRDDDEGPQRTVTIEAPFWVSKYEVTFAEWDACLAAGGCTTKPSDARWGRDNRPVIDVSWNDAKAYVFWLSDKTDQTYRLLSEAEWEYIARASSTTAFWWAQASAATMATAMAAGAVGAT